MIGSTITYTLGGEAREVKVRPADLFTAEDALGFDPLERFSDPTMLQRPTTAVIRALTAVTWAAHRRVHDPELELEAFGAQLEDFPRVEQEADDQQRPTLAAASGE